MGVQHVERGRYAVDVLTQLHDDLGGEYRGWHPRFYLNEWPAIPWDPLPERPADTEVDWNRPDLERASNDIGEMGERFLEAAYDMERVNGQTTDGSWHDTDEVDLVVTSGPYEGALIQAKAAAVRCTRGYSADGETYSTTPGGFYLKQENIDRLAAHEEPAFLHTIVHHPFYRDMEDADCDALSIPHTVLKGCGIAVAWMTIHSSPAALAGSQKP